MHRVIDQEAWLKKYINITELRKKASNDFEKDFFKLMNNAVFGKTMENVRELSIRISVMNIKTKDFYKDIAQDVEERFDTSNYDVDRPLPKGKNKKVICLMKDELGGGIITEFVALRPRTYSYMTDEFIEMKKAKGTKKCVIKKIIKFEDYKKCLFDNEPMLKSQQRFKSENHEVYTENINKIALSSNDDKRIVALDGITSYPYGYCGED